MINRINVTVPTAVSTTNVLLTTTQPFIAPRVDVILNISSIENLVPDATATLSLDDSVNILPLQDINGYNLRADRLTQRAANMPGGIAENTTISVKARVLTDPARLVVFTPTRRSQSIQPATTVATATGTGINIG